MALIRIDEEGVAHLPGSAHNTFETLCGSCDTSTDYEEDEGTPTCVSCIVAAQDFIKCATLKEIKSWKR